MAKRILFFIPLLLLSFSIFCKETVYVLTIPKSGTHLIEKYFNLLNMMRVEMPVDIAMSHFSEVYLGLQKGYLEQQEVKKIVLIRDLRDIFISGLHYVYGGNWLHDRVVFDSNWRNLSFDQQMIEFIDYESEPQHFQWKYMDRNLPQQTKKMIQKAIRFKQLPNTLVITFENLSGGNGIIAQEATIDKINSFMGLSLSKMVKQFVMKNLFGNAVIANPYFREGKSYQWKSILSPELCEMIKHLYGQDLIDLGYEKDLTWTSNIAQP